MKIIAKNTDIINALNIYISSGKTITISAGNSLNLLEYATSLELAHSDVPFHIDQGNITINDGEQDLPKLRALKLVYDVPITMPKVTADGDWHVVNENFAHVTGNEALNWTVEKYLDAGATFSEKIVIPNSRTFTLNTLEGGASAVPTHIILEWFEDIGSGIFMRRNPEIRIDEVNRTSVNGVHSASAIIITMSNTNNELDQIEPNLYYGFKDGTNATFYRKVNSIDTVANTITLDVGLPTGGVVDGTLFGLTDRVIGQKVNQIASSNINWISPPQFFGDGSSYLKITITNEDTVDAALVTAMINGWHTDSITGD